MLYLDLTHEEIHFWFTSESCTPQTNNSILYTLKVINYKLTTQLNKSFKPFYRPKKIPFHGITIL